MRWPWSRTLEPPPLPAPDRPQEVFTCSTCGRTDLPEAGDWDPPICLECDAAINHDADEEADWFDVG